MGCQVACQWCHQPTMRNEQAFLAGLREIDDVTARDDMRYGDGIAIRLLLLYSTTLPVG